MKTPELWHKTVLELAKSGMKYLDAIKMADGIIESYLRRYPENFVEIKLDPLKSCPYCKGEKVYMRGIGQKLFYCPDCYTAFDINNAKIRHEQNQKKPNDGDLIACATPCTKTVKA